MKDVIGFTIIMLIVVFGLDILLYLNKIKKGR